MRLYEWVGWMEHEFRRVASSAYPFFLYYSY
jgi:hypothetical protein